MSNKEKTEERAKKRRAKTIKKLAVWVLILGGAGFLMFSLVGSSDNISDNGSSIPPVTDADWVKWNTDSAVTLIEYSDFQCPACASYFPFLKAVEQEFGADVRFVYRHFPLIQIHFNASSAARASEAAGEQGMFWEMHDRLFQTQELWAKLGTSEIDALFAGYADNFRLDVDKFKADYNSDEIRERVNSAYANGVSSGISSTPTFYLNGEKISNPRDIEEFRVILSDALSKSETQ